ncbi:hypothetical protein D9M71_236780 [compost metagenome]
MRFAGHRPHAKHRAKDFLTPQRTVQRYVGEYRGADEIPAWQLYWPLTTAQQSRASFQARRDVLAYTLVLRLVDQCAHFIVAGKRIADADRLGPGLQPRDKVRIQGFGNQHPAGSRTHLPGIEKAAHAGQLHSQFQIRRFQYQQGRFAAQLQAHAFDGFRRPLHDLHAHRIAAGEGHLGDAWIGRQGGAHCNSGPADQVEHTLRQSGLGNHAGQLQLRQRRHFRRLEHHTAAGGQCWRQFPRGGDHGEIPRHDQPDHATRLTPQPRDEIVTGQCHRTVLPGIQLIGKFGVIAEGGDDIVHVHLRLGERLAVVAGLQEDQALATRLDPLGNRPQH